MKLVSTNIFKLSNANLIIYHSISHSPNKTFIAWPNKTVKTILNYMWSRLGWANTLSILIFHCLFILLLSIKADIVHTCSLFNIKNLQKIPISFSMYIEEVKIFCRYKIKDCKTATNVLLRQDVTIHFRHTQFCGFIVFCFNV